MKFDPREVDQEYKAFPSFKVWKKVSIDNRRWDITLEKLSTYRDESQDSLKEAFEIAKRAAAIESGAIEDLYKVNRGFTFTVALQTSMWEVELEKKGEDVKNHISAQLEGYDFVLDFATGANPIVPTWIRQLHSVICKHQKFYQVYTEIGVQKKELKAGEYKKLPNHVVTQEGEVHAYCPVEFTPQEMQRFCDEFQQKAFTEAHPVLQASYVHYVLTAIHPFSDGNGRVARALASVFTYRSCSVPILIFSDDKEEYFKALSEADNGEYSSFSNLILEKTIDSIDLVIESFKTAAKPNIEDDLKKLSALYYTKGGFTHDEVDQAGILFLNELSKIFQEILKEKITDESPLKSSVIIQTNGVIKTLPEGYRFLSNNNRKRIIVNLVSNKPVSYNSAIQLELIVPIDCGVKDDLLIRNKAGDLSISARFSQLLPTVSTALKLKMQVFVEGIIPDLIKKIVDQGLKNLKRL